MTQQRKASTQPKRPEPAKVNKKERKFVTWLGRVFGLKSFILLLAGIIFLYVCVTQNNGYKWTWENLLKSNWEFTHKYAKATLEERYQMKLGFNFAYLNYIKQNTPEDAIILFPLKEGNTEKVENYQLGMEVNNKFWVTHFLYPRKVVYKDEQDVNPLYKDISYVAIIAGRGYDDLDYFVRERTYYTVLPKAMNNSNMEDK